MSKVTLTDVQTGYRVTSVINDNNQTIEEAFDNTISRDGSTPNAMEAPLDMGGHKVLNVTPGTAASDAATKGQLDSLGQALPQTVIDQIATRVAAIINEGGGVVTPPGGYTNPPAPTAVTATVAAYNQITLAWTMSDTEWAEGYYVYRVGGGLIGTVRSAATLAFTDNSVSPLTTYRYEVTAYNETYDYETARTLSNQVTTGASTSNTAPGVPTSLTAVETTDSGTIRLTWAYNSTVPVEAFALRRNGSFFSYDDNPALRSVTLGGHTIGQRYTYSIAAFSSTGGYSAYASFPEVLIATPAANDPPDAPVITGVTVVSSTQLRVNWTHDGANLNGWRISITGPNGYYVEAPPQALATRQYTFTGLTPSTTYSIEVSAVHIADFGTPVPDFYSDTDTGTTSAGTAVTPLAIASPPIPTTAGTVYYDATTGVGISGVPTFTATGGVSPYVWSATSAVPSGLNVTSASSIGQITGTPALSTQGAKSITIRVVDAVGTAVSFILNLYIDTPPLVLTPPSGITSNLVATQSSAYASGNWTASGGSGTYTLNISGALPPGISPTEGATTCSINGTGTSAVGTIYPIVVSVTDTSLVAKSVIIEYNLDYRATAAVNRAPTLRSSFTNSFTITSGTPAATVLDADNIFIDPDGDALTYSIAIYAQGDIDPISDISTYGFTFNSSTGVLAYDGDTITPQNLVAVITADDVQNEPLRLTYNFTLTPTRSAPFPGLASAGFIASGGTGSYTYSWVSGSIPTWLASNAGATSIDSGTGLFVGGTGNVGTNATYGPYVFRVTDSGAATADVSVTFTTQDALVDDFVAKRVPGSYYATNFTGVYVNGALARTITAVNDLGDFNNASGNVTNDSGTLWGEANGGTNFPTHIDWRTDPTGLQAKVCTFVNLPTDTKSSGGFVKCIDGRQSGTVNGPNYSKLYYQIVYYADRNLFGYRYNDSDGDMKIMYVGGSQESGQVVVAAHGYTGFYHTYVDGSFGITNTRTDPTGYTKTPYPNPWSNTSLANRQPRPGIVYPASSAGKIAWYEAAGMLKWSSSGLTGDLGASLGVDYPSATAPYAPTKYLDERAHTIAGVDVGWPAAPVITGGAGRIHLNAWNVIQICVEYKPYDAVTNPLTLSSFAMWTAKYGDPPVLNVAMIDKMHINSTGQNAVWIGCYDTGRINPDTTRPTAYVHYKEMVMSPNRIPFPGGILPTLPAGLTG